MKKSHCIRLPGVYRGPDYFLPLEKHWIPAGVYPDENRGRNDVKQHQPSLSQPHGLEGDKEVIKHPHLIPLPCLRRSGFAQAGIKGEGKLNQCLFFY